MPDEADKIPALGARNDRMRREGTRNLLAAARRRRREDLRPEGHRVHIDEAARRTVPILEQPPGIED